MVYLQGTYKDIRTGKIYTDVYCSEENVKFFVKVEEKPSDSKD